MTLLLFWNGGGPLYSVSAGIGAPVESLTGVIRSAVAWTEFLGTGITINGVALTESVMPMIGASPAEAEWTDTGSFGADAGIPFEWGASVRTDLVAADEFPLSVGEGMASPITWSGTLQIGGVGQTEWITTIQRLHASPVEFGIGVGGIAPAAMEMLMGVVGIPSVQIEWGGTLGLGGAAAVPIEDLAGVGRATAEPVEAGLGVVGAVSPESEWLGRIGGTGTMPTDWVASVGGQAPADTEWLTAIPGGVAAIEALTGAGGGVGPSAEWSAGIAGASAAQTESLRGIGTAFVAVSESLGGVYGVPPPQIEWFGHLTYAALGQTESIAAVPAGGPAVPVEFTITASRFNATALVEFAAGAGQSQTAVTLEFQATPLPTVSGYYVTVAAPNRYSGAIVLSRYLSPSPLSRVNT